MEKISEAENEVMNIIWKQKRPMSPNEIIEYLNEDKEWKYSTVKTFLARLTQKGLIKCESGRVNTYEAIVTEKEYKRFETRRFIDTIHKGSIRSMIASLVRDDISDDKLEELMKELEESEDAKGASEKGDD